MERAAQKKPNYNPVKTMKLIDTDILIDFSHEISAAEQFLETLRNSGETLAISAITRMELVEGCRNKRELMKVIKFLGEFKLIHFSENIQGYFNLPRRLARRRESLQTRFT
ncbi:type II toxin-antitoxin system VapC family toxin [Candidatus Poribacteria bacterium]|nr:type II toxin-antitoxin system VapC family toxin [Candidatus Poribacteria bacterium]